MSIYIGILVKDIIFKYLKITHEDSKTCSKILFEMEKMYYIQEETSKQILKYLAEKVTEFAQTKYDSEAEEEKVLMLNRVRYYQQNRLELQCDITKECVDIFYNLFGMNTFVMNISLDIWFGKLQKTAKKRNCICGFENSEDKNSVFLAADKKVKSLVKSVEKFNGSYNGIPNIINYCNDCNNMISEYEKFIYKLISKYDVDS